MRCDALRARLFKVSLPADNLSMLTSPPKRMMFLTVLLIVLLAVATSGCGSHAPQPTTYTDKPFGYTITYDKARLSVPPSGPITEKASWWILPGETKYRGEISTAGMADRDGSDSFAGDAGGVIINSFSADRTIVPPTLARLRRGNAFFLAIATLKTPIHLLGDLAPHPAAPATIGGLAGFKFDGVWKGGHWVTYALFDGRRMYWLECRASLAAWPGIAATLEAALQSFRITN